MSVLLLFVILYMEIVVSAVSPNRRRAEYNCTCIWSTLLVCQIICLYGLIMFLTLYRGKGKNIAGVTSQLHHRSFIIAVKSLTLHMLH